MIRRGLTRKLKLKSSPSIILQIVGSSKETNLDDFCIHVGV